MRYGTCHFVICRNILIGQIWNYSRKSLRNTTDPTTALPTMRNNGGIPIQFSVLEKCISSQILTRRQNIKFNL